MLTPPLQDEVEALRRELSAQLADGGGEANSLRRKLVMVEQTLSQSNGEKATLEAQLKANQEEAFRQKELLDSCNGQLALLKAKEQEQGSLVQRLATKALSPPKGPPLPGSSAGGAYPLLLSSSSASEQGGGGGSGGAAAAGGCGAAAGSQASFEFAASEVRRLENTLAGKDAAAVLIKENHAALLAKASLEKQEMAVLFAQQRRELERKVTHH